MSAETHPGGDDDRLESLENRFDGDRRVHAAERIRDTSRDPSRQQQQRQRSFHLSSVLVKNPHLKCNTGLAIVGVLSSKGSMMMVKPLDETSKVRNKK